MPIKTILAGNKINRIQAILNGTTNYILTKMDVDGASYEDVLKEAQELGYAETDPTGDVEGFDAAYKITTLSTIAFKKRVKIENVYREGITKIRKEDMAKANEFGYKIKLIATATIDENDNADQAATSGQNVPKQTACGERRSRQSRGPGCNRAAVRPSGCHPWRERGDCLSQSFRSAPVQKSPLWRPGRCRNARAGGVGQSRWCQSACAGASP